MATYDESLDIHYNPDMFSEHLGQDKRPYLTNTVLVGNWFEDRVLQEELAHYADEQHAASLLGHRAEELRRFQESQRPITLTPCTGDCTLRYGDTIQLQSASRFSFQDDEDEQNEEKSQKEKACCCEMNSGETKCCSSCQGEKGDPSTNCCFCNICGEQNQAKQNPIYLASQFGHTNDFGDHASAGCEGNVPLHRNAFIIQSSVGSDGKGKRKLGEPVRYGDKVYCQSVMPFRGRALLLTSDAPRFHSNTTLKTRRQSAWFTPRHTKQCEWQFQFHEPAVRMEYEVEQQTVGAGGEPFIFVHCMSGKRLACENVRIPDSVGGTKEYEVTCANLGRGLKAESRYNLWFVKFGPPTNGRDPNKYESKADADARYYKTECGQRELIENRPMPPNDSEFSWHEQNKSESSSEQNTYTRETKRQELREEKSRWCGPTPPNVAAQENLDCNQFPDFTKLNTRSKLAVCDDKPPSTFSCAGDQRYTEAVTLNRNHCSENFCSGDNMPRSTAASGDGQRTQEFWCNQTGKRDDGITEKAEYHREKVFSDNSMPSSQPRSFPPNETKWSDNNQYSSTTTSTFEESTNNRSFGTSGGPNSLRQTSSQEKRVRFKDLS